MSEWWSARRTAFRVQLAIAIALPLGLLVLQQGKDSTEYAAFLLGIGVGAVCEQRWLCLEICPGWWKRVCTAVIGIAGMIALQYLLKGWSGQLEGLALRDTLIGLWGTLGAPWVFRLCGLYERQAPL